MTRVYRKEKGAAQQGPQRMENRRWLCRLKQHGPQQQPNTKKELFLYQCFLSSSINRSPTDCLFPVITLMKQSKVTQDHHSVRVAQVLPLKAAPCSAASSLALIMKISPLTLQAVVQPFDVRILLCPCDEMACSRATTLSPGERLPVSGEVVSTPLRNFNFDCTTTTYSSTDAGSDGRDLSCWLDFILPHSGQNLFPAADFAPHSWQKLWAAGALSDPMSASAGITKLMVPEVELRDQLERLAAQSLADTVFCFFSPPPFVRRCT